MIEQLESRIAPAAVIHFFEPDGDRVTIKTSKGNRDDLLSVVSHSTDANDADIVFINFLASPELAATFARTNLTVTAAHGSGPTRNKVDFVYINAFDDGDPDSIDLGKVNIKGNLVSIDAGDSDLDTFAIRSLTVTNWLPSPDTGAGAVSEIHGDVPSIKVKGDFDGFIESVDFNGSANFLETSGDFYVGTRIGRFVVGGDIAFLNGEDVGHLQVQSIGLLKVNGVFYGTDNGSRNNGLIETTEIDRISLLGGMDFNAHIELFSATI